MIKVRDLLPSLLSKIVVRASERRRNLPMSRAEMKEITIEWYGQDRLDADEVWFLFEYLELKYA